MNSNHNSTTEIAAPKRWTLRPYREGDIPAISALWSADFAAAGLKIVMTESEITADFSRPDYDPTKQVLIAVEPEDGESGGEKIVGFGEMTIIDDPEHKDRVYRFLVIAAPISNSSDLEHDLARAIIDLARKDIATAPDGTTAQVRYGCSDQQLSQMALCQALGIPQIRFFWTMAIPLDNLEEPATVEGVTLRTYRVPDDNEGARLAFNDSFSDHFDSHPSTPERWTYRMSTPTIRPDLSWLAEVDAEPGKFGGFCICGIFADENAALGRHEGWIELLGTTREWRRKGLGRSLVLHGLHSLKEAGMTTGKLGVDSTSLTGADRLYESVGFKVVETFVAFGCPLDEIKV